METQIKIGCPVRRFDSGPCLHTSGSEMVIQLFVFPDGWLNAHMFWAAILFAVVALGPGKISLDHVIERRNWRRMGRGKVN